MFIARRFKLVAATKKAKTAREYEQGIKEHGGDFYSKGSGLTAAEVNERLRERLAGDDGE
jgi:hypothetical protein